MRATAVFVVFFVLFTTASIAVPIPLFPGNAVQAWLKTAIQEYSIYMGAVANGLLYGFLMWTVLFLIDRRINRTSPTDFSEEHDQDTESSYAS